MKYLLIFLIFSFTSVFPKSISDETIYLPKKNLPLELTYLLESIQGHIKSKSDKASFESKVKKLDQLFEKLDKEDLFFIIKSESYKTILKIKHDYPIKLSYYDPKVLSSFNKFFKSTTISSFSKWAVRSIYNDLKNVFSSSDFTTYNYRRKNNAVLTKEYILVERKLKILLPWVGYVAFTQPNELEEDMKKSMFKLFDKILIYTEEYLQYTKFEKLEISPVKDSLKYFVKTYPVKSKKTLSDEMKSTPIEEVTLDQESFLVDEDVPPSTWTPKGASLVPTPLPTPDPNYVRPQVLPKPTSDWLDNI